MSVFIDTAIFMYAGGRDHPLREPSQDILQRVNEGKLSAVTSVEVIQEILHRFIAVRQPHTGVAMATDVTTTFAPLLPVTHNVIVRMPALVERYPGLAARDLIHVATCLEEGIGDIVTPDRGFDAVDGIRRIDPASD